MGWGRAGRATPALFFGVQMDGKFVLDIVTSLGALGILGVFFLYTFPKMQSETLATFKEMVLRFQEIDKAREQIFDIRVDRVMNAMDKACRYQG